MSSIETSALDIWTAASKSNRPIAARVAFADPDGAETIERDEKIQILVLVRPSRQTQIHPNLEQRSRRQPFASNRFSRSPDLHKGSRVSRLNGTRRIQHTIIVDRLFHHPHRLVLILSKFWVDRLEYSRSQLSRHFLPSALSSVCDRFQATFQALMIKGNERKKNRSGIASKQRSKDS